MAVDTSGGNVDVRKNNVMAVIAYVLVAFVATQLGVPSLPKLH